MRQGGQLDGLVKVKSIFRLSKGAALHAVERQDVIQNLTRVTSCTGISNPPFPSSTNSLSAHEPCHTGPRRIHQRDARPPDFATKARPYSTELEPREKLVRRQPRRYADQGLTIRDEALGKVRSLLLHDLSTLRGFVLEFELIPKLKVFSRRFLRNEGGNQDEYVIDEV